MQYSNVLSPIRIGKFLFKNRVIVAPTGIVSLDIGANAPTDETMEFWASRAKTGAGVVTVTGYTVVPEFEQRWDINVPLTKNRLATLVDRIHYHGALASMEVVSTFNENRVVSKGAPNRFGNPGEEVSTDEMMRFRDRIVESMPRLKDIGFDGILLHFGHDRTLAQFLSPFRNKRTDEYGGSFENRTRYILDILSSVRQAIGKDMFIEARISGSEYQPGGIDLEEGIRIGEALSPYLDILQVSAGMHTPEWMTHTHPTGFRPPMPNAHLAKAFKESGRISCKIATIGAIKNLQDADDLIASGTADFTVMGRSLIADPEMISKCRDGRIEDVVPCIQCMRCHDSAIYEGHMGCTVNPRAGLVYWIDRMVEPAAKSKKVAVIGGGPAGMKAALTAAERGHAVTLYEMSDALGGLMKYAEHVSFKHPHARYVKYLIGQIEKSPVQVELDTRATPEMIQAAGYDAVITAVGSEPVVPRIPGVEHAVTALEAHNTQGTLGEDIVIVGGGQVGIELALHLKMLGKNPTVLEMQEEIAPDASKTQRNELIVETGNAGLAVLTSAKCTSIEPGKVFFEHEGATKSLEADNIVIAAGMRPRTAENDAFIMLPEFSRSIGDCNASRIMEDATREAYYAAMSL